MATRGLILVDVFILMYTVRWYVGATRINGTSLTFEGGYWSFLGYYLLFFVSIFTIIGWAWVSAAWWRWGRSGRHWCWLSLPLCRTRLLP